MRVGGAFPEMSFFCLNAEEGRRFSAEGVQGQAHPRAPDGRSVGDLEG